MTYLKNNKVLLLIIAVLVFTNIAVLYLHVWKKHRGPRVSMREQMMNKLEKEVGFNKQQLASYDSLRANHFETMKPLFEELRSAKDSFFGLIHKPEVTDSVFSFYSSRIQQKQQAIDTKMLRYFWSLRNLCTEEQKSNMDSFLQTITKRMSGGGRHGSNPPGKKK